MSKHTPWITAEGGWIEDANGSPVVQYAGCGSHEAEWASAEAKAIALAAPELLEALIAIEREKSEYMTRNNLGDPSVESTNIMARAAIAKATGEA